MAKLKAEKDEHLAKSRIIEGFIDEMLNAPLVLAEWQDQLWNMLVRKAVIAADGTVAFTFKGEKNDHGQGGMSILTVFLFRRDCPPFSIGLREQGYEPTGKLYKPTGSLINLRESGFP